MKTQNEDTKRRLERDCISIRKVLMAHPGVIDDTVLSHTLDTVWQSRATGCTRSANQVRRRLYRAICFLFPFNHVPRPPNDGNMKITSLGLRENMLHFTDNEVQRLSTASQTIGPGSRAFLLVELLMTTGARLSAIAGLTWGDVRDPRSGMRHNALIIEKGQIVHMVMLTDTVRAALVREEARSTLANAGVPPNPATRVLKVGPRQLRNIFYRVCERAYITGPHCHPHACRHTVAHRLFTAGNPIALVAKYLGHTNIETTNRYYLRLSFDELISRLVIPWTNN
jgi:integrase